MAELSAPILEFPPGLVGDPGRRTVALPPPLPEPGDDFEWRLRDFDRFRSSMLQELMARFPERRRWTTADIEVVLIEVLAAALDQLSDLADRVAAESYLGTARQLGSLDSWLEFVGFNAMKRPEFPAGEGSGSGDGVAEEARKQEGDDRHSLYNLWGVRPDEMERDRAAGPASIRRQMRMASLHDYEDLLRKHPLVISVRASPRWSGSWTAVLLTTRLWNEVSLEDCGLKGRLPTHLRNEIEKHHESWGAKPPTWSDDETLREILRRFIAPYRLVAQEVALRDVIPVGLDLVLTVNVDPSYFRSETRREVRRLLGRGPGGFFEPGRLRLGQAIEIGDLYEWVMNVEGVETAAFRRFKRMGDLFPDRTEAGRIEIGEIELAVCDNDPSEPPRGHLLVDLQGGRPG